MTTPSDSRPNARPDAPGSLPGSLPATLPDGSAITAPIATPIAAPIAAPPADDGSRMTHVYVSVMAVEAVALLGLWWLQTHFG